MGFSQALVHYCARGRRVNHIGRQLPDGLLEPANRIAHLPRFRFRNLVYISNRCASTFKPLENAVHESLYLLLCRLLVLDDQDLKSIRSMLNDLELGKSVQISREVVYKMPVNMGSVHRNKRVINSTLYCR